MTIGDKIKEDYAKDKGFENYTDFICKTPNHLLICHHNIIKNIGLEMMFKEYLNKSI